MKIGILTQPLHNNYGGLLQNFALQKVLKGLGHEVLTINIKGRESSFIRKCASISKRVVLKIFGRSTGKIRKFPTVQEKKIISEHTSQFVVRNINTTKPINRKVNEGLLSEYAFEAYVVGSDQVWRPRYSPQQSTFFLDFLKNNSNVKKLSYAASFGVSDWEFNQKQTEEFSPLLKQFDAVSVREDSAVDLCKRYFDVDATHLLDPTMLLDKEVYISLVEKQNIGKSPGNLFIYILDKNEEKSAIVDSVANKYKLEPFTVMAKRGFSEPGKRDIKDCVFPPVEEWIRGFMDAEFVITDSFHGTVFSILFNRPFIAIANKSRGTTRFTSLLKMFNLENRLIFSPEELNLDKVKEIDWGNVNEILEQDKERAIFFLKRNLL
jgi:hypothetical protein